MTEKQKAVFDSLRALIARNGAPPSLRELGQESGIPNVSNVHRIVTALHRDGYVMRAPGRSRGMIPVCDLPTESEGFARSVLGRVLVQIDHIEAGKDPADVALNLLTLAPIIRETLQ